MRALSILAMATGAALLAGAAMAQDGPQNTMSSDMPMNQAGAPAQAQTGDMAPTSSLGSPDHPMPQNSPTAPDQAYQLKASDPTVVTNGPVADTPQNRQAYGQPMSHAGKATSPTGD